MAMSVQKCLCNSGIRNNLPKMRELVNPGRPVYNGWRAAENPDSTPDSLSALWIVLTLIQLFFSLQL